MMPVAVRFMCVLGAMAWVASGCTTLKSEVVFDAKGMDAGDSGEAEVADVMARPSDSILDSQPAPDVLLETIEAPVDESLVDESIFENSPNCNDGVRAAYEYCLSGQGAPLPMQGVRTLDLGDVDKDGLDDLLITYPEEVRIRVLWGASYIPFSDVLLDEEMPEETVAYSSKFLDLDGDGSLDILASGYGYSFLALRGDGAGFFEPFEAPLFQPHYYHRMWRKYELMDVNADGLTDLVGFRDAYESSSWGYPVVIIRNADGSFAYPRLVTSARSAVFVDLDLDGDLDVVMEDQKGEFLRVAWQKNDAGVYPIFEVMEEGLGGSSGTPVLWKLPTRKPARFLVAARDAFYEAAVGHPEGVLGFDLLGTTDSIGTRPWYPELLDADLDGVMDVLVGGTYQSRFALLISREGEPLGSVINGDAGPTRDAMALGEVDGDGHPDAVFWSASEEALRVVSLSPESLGERTPGILSVEQSTEQTASGDLNGDGFEDVVGVHSEQGMRIHLGNGLGGVMRQVDLDIPGMDPTGLAVGDLDGDGVQEAVAVGTSRMTVVQVNDFGATKLTTQLLPYTAHAVAVAAKPDATGDGIADLFVTDMNQKVYMLRGDGALGFELQWTATHEGDGAGVRVGDFNDDGYSGCVTFGKYPKTLTRAFLNVAGVLDTAPTPLSITSRHVETGDVNGDGLDDIVGGGGGGSAVVGFAQPAGGFRVVERDGDLSDEQSGLAVVDLDGDGSDEIVVPEHGELVVLKANFDASIDFGTPPQEVQRIPKYGYQRRLMPGDINGDGSLDLWSLRSGRLLGAVLNEP